MIGRINHTGRGRILRKDVTIKKVLNGGNGGYELTVEVDFSRYNFSGESNVSVEAYHQTAWDRKDYGKLDELNQPLKFNLSNFTAIDNVLFRIRLTDSSGDKGKLIAEADRIPLFDTEDEKESRVSLLWTDPRDLGDLVWKLEIDPSPAQPPKLLINDIISDWRGLALSDYFLTLVYPAVIREVLAFIFNEEDIDITDKSDWRSQWLIFAKSLPSIDDIPKDEHEQSDWIDSVIHSFARKHKLQTKFINTIWEKGDRK